MTSFTEQNGVGCEVDWNKPTLGWPTGMNPSVRHVQLPVSPYAGASYA